MHRKVILTLRGRLTLLVQAGNLLLVQKGYSYSLYDRHLYLSRDVTRTFLFIHKSTFIP